MTEKLDNKLEDKEIKQTREPVKPIRFREEYINKVNKENYIFGKKKDIFVPFSVSKDTH